MEHFLQDLKYCCGCCASSPPSPSPPSRRSRSASARRPRCSRSSTPILLRPFPYPGSGPDRDVHEHVAATARARARRRRSSRTGGGRPTSCRTRRRFATCIVNYTGGDTPEQVTSGNVERDFFRLWGAKTLLGRTFSTEEDRPNGPHVAVLSYGWWTRRFASDPNDHRQDDLAQRRSVRRHRRARRRTSIRRSSSTRRTCGPRSRSIRTPATRRTTSASAARLKPGVTLAQAQAKLKQSADEFRAKFPNALGRRAGFSVEPIQKVFVRNSTVAARRAARRGRAACCSSPARTSPICCSCARRCANARWRFARRWAPTAAASFAS